MGSSTEKSEMSSIVKAIDDQLEKREFSLDVLLFHFVLSTCIGNKNTKRRRRRIFATSSLLVRVYQRENPLRWSDSINRLSFTYLFGLYRTMYSQRDSDSFSSADWKGHSKRNLSDQWRRSIRAELVLLEWCSIMCSKRVIHQLITSIMNASAGENPSIDSIDSIYESVLQQLCRTRIGEYCLNELSRNRWIAET